MASGGYGDNHVRASAMYTGALVLAIVCLLSADLPAVILPPKPPLIGGGHMKASTAAPKEARLRPISVAAPRLRNWRRVTASVSASGGTNSAIGAGVALTGTTSLPRRSS